MCIVTLLYAFMQTVNLSSALSAWMGGWQGREYELIGPGVVWCGGISSLDTPAAGLATLHCSLFGHSGKTECRRVALLFVDADHLVRRACRRGVFFMLSYRMYPFLLSYLMYPVVRLTVGALPYILQPASSTPRDSRLSAVWYSNDDRTESE